VLEPPDLFEVLRAGCARSARRTEWVPVLGTAAKTKRWRWETITPPF
jgi:hypothetical protein